MSSDEKSTGTDNVTYNVVSVLYHTLQEAETMEKYIADAKSSGNDDVIRFFNELQEEDRRRGERARGLLRTLLGER